MKKVKYNMKFTVNVDTTGIMEVKKDTDVTITEEMKVEALKELKLNLAGELGLQLDEIRIEDFEATAVEVSDNE